MPTDGVRLRHLVANTMVEDVWFDKRTYCIIDSSEANTFPYLDCVELPYINEEDIYKSFLKDRNIEISKEHIKKYSDFGAAFRWFIDNNSLYGHSLYSEYYLYEEKYIKPFITEWCKNNDIKVR